jgi:hypothetical protein
MLNKDVTGSVHPSVCTMMSCKAGKVASARVKKLSKLMALKLGEFWSHLLQELLKVMMSRLASERPLPAGEVTFASLNSSMSMLMVFWS